MQGSVGFFPSLECQLTERQKAESPTLEEHRGKKRMIGGVKEKRQFGRKGGRARVEWNEAFSKKSLEPISKKGTKYVSSLYCMN